jgi:hypothetical protein
MTSDQISPTAGVFLRQQPAISWAAILAGASVSIAMSLLLTLAAAGLGYTFGSSVLASRSALAAFTPVVGAVAIAVQVLSAALGGFLAGRLRTIWIGVHDDESHFRDTAHGLITWAVATLGGAVLAATVLGPYSDQLAAASSTASAALTAAQAERAANIAAQSSLFIAVGMLLSAFVAAVAARLGGLEHQAMHAKAPS